MHLYVRTVAASRCADRAHPTTLLPACPLPPPASCRYPVVLHAFRLRPGSGGEGCWRGGDGVIREVGAGGCWGDRGSAWRQGQGQGRGRGEAGAGARHAQLSARD